MSRNLTGKVAVVIGGSKGIGQAFVKGLAEDGADVAIARHLSSRRNRANGQSTWT